MTLALVLIIAAVFALVVILGITVSTRLQLSPGSALVRKIEPIDIEAFRNLVDPTENEYLLRRGNVYARRLHIFVLLDGTRQCWSPSGKPL
jgi:hypothetical protein